MLVLVDFCHSFKIDIDSSIWRETFSNRNQPLNLAGNFSQIEIDHSIWRETFSSRNRTIARLAGNFFK
jgi:hypothetical protein